MDNLNKIKECMRNDPDIIRIGENGEKFLIDANTRLYTNIASNFINLLNYMEEKNLYCK